MQELFDGVYLLEGEVGGRPLQLTYLRGNSASLLLDTGVSDDPEKFIAGQIHESGGIPENVTWIINTHPDLDHTGGNYAMKRIAPKAILACGDADREACSSFDNLFRLRYDVYRNDHQIFYDREVYKGFKAKGGNPQPIEATFIGGEHIRLGDDWEVEVVALPGHAKSHLGILDLKHQALFGGDAIHGRVYMGLDGLPKLPPTYIHIDDYLSTIRFIEHVPITMYVGCHWQVKQGNEVAAFCAESREFVMHVDQLLKDLVIQPHSLLEICQTLGPRLGDWPRGADRELACALEGHLTRLIDQGVVITRIRQEEPRVVEYMLA